ncbi:MAG: amino acid permease [Bacteroidales bacterium]|nr:amino acid permease [Bacteroidales bacterium]
MEKAKKFGAFAGVFTPSLLTILGVIMYMRLGWVVGQAGLISALVIIVLAHVISISTGLSISSIATDKKIKAGGIYYILSRSLGLPIGGAIGITLFIGTALSISLYLVGFAESFLSIDAIRNFTGLEQNVMGIRIVGTAAIIFLVVLAFISTSVAIKTQFYIMVAIGLSLISIFVGFFVNDGFTATTVSISYFRDGVSPELVFAIFFPAVTGFTAGVAMSGDLKDPQKTIPRGTLAAIATGFIIYVVLAVGFALYVDRDVLLTDYNFLMKIAWFAPFVIAGIWGATLSSALGGILGGPRILQATSADKVTPKIFARGYGASNEPRNALLLIFLIAEAGILIGELDVIAGIVTMFYLASYGFINIAFFLENWASTDFRPSFRVSRYVGLVGFIAAFGVMFKLDMVSMFAAFIIMGLLYYYLKRKQRNTNTDDVWQSVYSSLIRTALHRMQKGPMEQRNWQPNIILFSGGTEKRPHLIEFGKSLVGRHGVLSNFDLKENKDARILVTRTDEDLLADAQVPGMFTQRKTVKDLYDGIESIAGVYGFSGFEPNTVMMGWARETRQPERFAEMLKTLYELDLNVLLLDWDKRTGFGTYKTIDIWWKDISNQGNLALALSKLLLLSDQWSEATIRLMIVNSLKEQQDHIHLEAKQLLETLRINATVKVIDNHIKQLPFYEIVQVESRLTDLVITGIPELEKGRESEYVETTSILLQEIGTVLLIKASSTFKQLSLETDKHLHTYIPDYPVQQTSPEKLKGSPENLLPEGVPEELKKLHTACVNLISTFYKDFVQPAFRYNTNKVLALEKNILESIKQIESTSFRNLPVGKQARQLAYIKTNQLVLSEKIIEELQQTILKKQQEGLSKGIQFLVSGIQKIVDDSPATFRIKLFSRHFEIRNSETLSARNFKRSIRFIHSEKRINQGITYTVRLQRMIRKVLPEGFTMHLNDSLIRLSQTNLDTISQFRSLLQAIQSYFDLLQHDTSPAARLDDAKKEVLGAIQTLKALSEGSNYVLSERLVEQVSLIFVDISNLIDSGAPNQNVPKENQAALKQLLRKLSMGPVFWAGNRVLLYNGIKLDIRLRLLAFRLQKIVDRFQDEIRQLTNSEVLLHAESLKTRLKQFREDLQHDATKQFNLDESELQWDDRTVFQLALDKIIEKSLIGVKAMINKLPESTELLVPASILEPAELIGENLKPLTIPTYQLVDYHVQRHLFEALHKMRGTFPKSMYTAAGKIKNSLRLVSIGNMNAEVKSTLEMVLREDDAAGRFPGGGERFPDFVNEQLTVVEEELENIRHILLHLHDEMEQNIISTVGELTVTRLLNTPDTYKQYIKKRDARHRFNLLKNTLRSARQRLYRLSAAIWYRQSDALLLAKKISSGDGNQRSVVDSLLTLHERVTPQEELLNKLPFYYRQLFLQKYNFKFEFWVNRQKEITQVRQSISRYMNGFPGGILIRGDRNSGKTFFINYISSNLLSGHQVYAISTPPAGSCNPADFLKALRESTGIDGNADQIFNALEEDSLIVIDDLELWWEKSRAGNAVVETIAELIRNHGHKCMFILTVSEASYRVINQVSDIESCMLSVVDLKPFNTLAIQEVIMFRHLSSGLEIRRSDKGNIRLTRTAQAKLFAKYFSYTRGNIGAALLAWVSNITDFKDDTLYIRQPQTPGSAILDRLSPNVRLYLVQFLLHKRLDLSKLQRLTLDPIETVEKQLLFLKRTGLINERAGHIYELGRYLYINLKNIIQ